MRSIQIIYIIHTVDLNPTVKYFGLKQLLQEGVYIPNLHMKQLTVLSFLLLLASFSMMAQEGDCDGDRYLNHVFTEVDSTMDVQYGQASTLGGKSQSLLMDIYEPHGDSPGLRPLVIMAHGGAFVKGDRAQTAEFCRDFAKRGYVVANMEYRLIDALFLDSIGMFEVVIMAINDMRAAVRYFKEDAANANTFRIGSESIFVAGVSAGAIMASHLGFLDPMDEIPEYLQTIFTKHGGFEGNSSNNTQYSSEVQAVLNYSGGLMRSSWIDSDDVPVYSAHDDKDPTVPCDYNTSNAIPIPVYLYGSCAMKSSADLLNIPNQLYLVPNSTGHVSYFYNESSKEIVLQESAAFLKTILCVQTSGVSEKLAKNEAGISVYPNPFENYLNIETETNIQAISVMNLMGQSYLETDSFTGNHLDLSPLPSGIYLLRLKTHRGTSVIKIIKE